MGQPAGKAAPRAGASLAPAAGIRQAPPGRPPRRANSPSGRRSPCRARPAPWRHTRWQPKGQRPTPPGRAGLGPRGCQAIERIASSGQAARGIREWCHRLPPATVGPPSWHATVDDLKHTPTAAPSFVSRQQSFASAAQQAPHLRPAHPLLLRRRRRNHHASGALPQLVLLHALRRLRIRQLPLRRLQV